MVRISLVSQVWLLAEEPIAAFQEVERSVGQTYDAIVAVLKLREHFAAAGGDKKQAVYFTRLPVEVF